MALAPAGGGPRRPPPPRALAPAIALAALALGCGGSPAPAPGGPPAFKLSGIGDSMMQGANSSALGFSGALRLIHSWCSVGSTC